MTANKNLTFFMKFSQEWKIQISISFYNFQLQFFPSAKTFNFDPLNLNQFQTVWPSYFLIFHSKRRLETLDTTLHNYPIFVIPPNFGFWSRSAREVPTRLLESKWVKIKCFWVRAKKGLSIFEIWNHKRFSLFDNEF